MAKKKASTAASLSDGSPAEPPVIAGDKADGSRPSALTAANFYGPDIVELLESKVWAANGLRGIAMPLITPPCGYANPLLPTYPLTGVAKIECTNAAGASCIGSAFLVWVTPQRQVLLTAAHNIQPKPERKPRSAKVWLPDVNGVLTPVTVQGCLVSTGWQNSPGDTDRDYGVIFISGATSFNSVISPVVVTPPKCLHLTPAYTIATMTGYPTAQKIPYTNTGPFTSTMTGPAFNTLGYVLNSCDGQSGGPIYITAINPATGLSYCGAVGVQAYGPIQYVGISSGPMVDAIMQTELTGWCSQQNPCLTLALQC